MLETFKRLSNAIESGGLLNGKAPGIAEVPAVVAFYTAFPMVAS
jgi:hypothetical protein